VNRLLTRAGNSYTNDTNGNTLTGGGRTNTWDSQNRLVQCVNGATTSTFKYGSDGLRRQMTSGGTTTDYAMDGQSVVRELRGGSVYATYLTGASGPMYRRDATGNVRWYLYDGLGSVQGEVDPSGNVTASRKFDVYGLVRGSTGTSTSKHKFVGGLGHTSEDEASFNLPSHQPLRIRCATVAASWHKTRAPAHRYRRAITSGGARSARLSVVGAR